MTEQKRGRPRAAIDLEKLETLCQIGCTNREIAAHFNVSERTIEQRRENARFRETMERAEAMGNISLRRKQMKMALEGDRVMLVWLGKQRLGQRDKVEQSGKLEHAHTHALDLSGLAEEELDALERIISKAGLAGLADHAGSDTSRADAAQTQ